MTRLSRPVDMQEWMARIEERLRTVEGRVNQVPRPPTAAGPGLYGPNILPNPTFESGTDGWLPPSNAKLTATALQGAQSLRLDHTASAVTERVLTAFEGGCTAVRSYEGNGSYQTDQYAYQGDYGGGSNRSSLIWCDSSQWAAAQGIVSGDVNELLVGIDWDHWFNSSGGTAIIGSNHIATIPPTGQARPAAGGNWDDDIFRVVWESRNMFKWLDLKPYAVFVNAFITGTLRGIMLGQTPAGVAYYGYALPTVKIRGSYYKTVVSSSAALSSTLWGSYQAIPGASQWEVSWLVNCSVPGTAAIGVGWAVNSTDAQTAVQATSVAVQPGITTRVTGLASVPGTARFITPYITVTGNPPNSTNPDGSQGPKIPWSFTVDDASLRQKVG